MQLNLFDDISKRQSMVKFVVSQITNSDSKRKNIKRAIQNNDRQELIKLFNESIRTFGFSNIEANGSGSWTWNSGTLKNTSGNEEYKITATELVNVALTMFGSHRDN